MSSPPPKHSQSSPTSSNASPVLPTPSSSISNRSNQQSQLEKEELEQQLLEKQNQLQELNSGIGKNVLTRQINELEEKLKDFDVDHSISSFSKDKLKSLEKDLSAIRGHPLIRNKEKKLLNPRSPNIGVLADNDPLPSPSASTLLPPPHDSPALLPLPPPPSGSTPTKRRSKIPNADRRNTDIEFATEIGQGLLSEVRKMQALLQEKEEKLRILEMQKADLEKAAEAMLKQMHQIEENEEKLKETNWNLECKNEELVTTINVLQTNLTKANAEQNKVAKQVDKLRAEIEQLHDREERLMATMDQMKLRHEQDMSSMRRQTAMIQREKADQSKQIEILNSELAIAKSKSRMAKNSSVAESALGRRRSGDFSIDDLALNKNEASASAVPTSPKQAPPPIHGQTVPLDTYNMMLARAHRVIMNHRVEIKEDKAEKKEMRKLLRQLQEKVESFQNDPRLWEDAEPTRDGRSPSRSASRFERRTAGRRVHKVASSIKPRIKKKRAEQRPKQTNNRAKKDDDNDSIFSYSTIGSLSDSSEESDVDAGSSSNRPTVKSRRNRATESESGTPTRRHSETCAPMGVDAEINTDPLDELEPLSSIVDAHAQPMPRSLGDELSMALSQSPSAEAEPTLLTDSIRGSIGAAFGSSTEQKTGIEISTQTETEAAVVIPTVETAMQTDDITPVPTVEVLTQTDFSADLVERSMQTEPKPEGFEVSVQTTEAKRTMKDVKLAVVEQEPTTAVLEVTSQEALSGEPKDSIVPEAAFASAIAMDRLARLEAAVDSETQCEQEESPKIDEHVLESVIAEARMASIKAAVNSETQCEPVEPVIDQSVLNSAIAEARLASLEAAVDCGVQSDIKEEPTIDQNAIDSAIAASRLANLEAAKDRETQYEYSPTNDFGTQTEIEGNGVEVQDSLREVNRSVVQHEEKHNLESAADDLPTHKIDNESIIEQHTISARSNEKAEMSDESKLVLGAAVATIDDSTVSPTINPITAVITNSTTDSTVGPTVEPTIEPTIERAVVTTVTSLDDSSISPTVTSTINSTANSTNDPTVNRAVASMTDSTTKPTFYSSIDRAIVSKVDPTVHSTLDSTAASMVDSTIDSTAASTVYSTAASTVDSSFDSIFDSTFDSTINTTVDRAINSTDATTDASVANSTADSITDSTATIIQQPSLQLENLNAETAIDRNMTSSPVGFENQPDIAENIYDEDGMATKTQTMENDIVTHVYDPHNRSEKTLTRYYTTNEFILEDDISLNDETATRVKEEKVYTKHELDTLVASAVALALSNAAIAASANNATDEHTEKLISRKIAQNDNYTSERAVDNGLIHTTGSTAKSEYDEVNHDGEYGSVVIHQPSENISMPYRRDRRNSGQLLQSTTQYDKTSENQDTTQYESIKPSHPLLELSMGPSTVFEQEPVEDITSRSIINTSTDKTNNDAEAPARPSNRPPIDLLNKAAVSSNLDLASPSVHSYNNTIQEQPSYLKAQDSMNEETISRVNGTGKKMRSFSVSTGSTDHTNEKLRSATSLQLDTSTQSLIDPAINLVTHTMIGEWLWKYTRKAVGGGFSEFRHQRYFWIHPYTRTLYWSATAPGVDGNETKAKSAMIENITTIPNNGSTDGLPDVSLLIQTSNRNLKITAPSLEKHQLWLDSISYLLARNGHGSSTGLGFLNDSRGGGQTMNTRSISSGTTGSLLNRPNFRRLHDIFQPPTVSTSTPSMLTSMADLDMDDDALEDVRMCCNGKHHVSKLEKDHTHRHHYRNNRKTRGGTISTIG